MAADRLGLNPNQRVELEGYLIDHVHRRDSAADQDRLTPRMFAAAILRTVDAFLAAEAEEDREFTHCPECAQPNGTNPDCDCCADYRSTAAAEHQAAEQEAAPTQQETSS